MKISERVIELFDLKEGNLYQNEVKGNKDGAGFNYRESICVVMRGGLGISLC